LKKMNVEVVCTTDDPIDSLKYHEALQNGSAKPPVEMRPAFRPDRAYAFDNAADYNAYIDSLEEITGYSIRTFDDLMAALENRIDYFDAYGAAIADHGLSYIPPNPTDTHTANSLFECIRSGKALSGPQKHSLTYRILLELGRIYNARGWVQQFHLGPLRDNNERKKQAIGSDAGFDSIGDFSQAQTLAHFMNELDKTAELPKTILYNNNPADNAVFSSMIGNFNDGSVKGKIQHGAAWWHMDQKDGIE